MQRKLDFDNVENFEVQHARIVVIGSGGAGCNTVSRLTDLGIEGAEVIAMNTDAKHLSVTKAHRKILLGKEITKGFGAGGYPDIGKQAALESKNEIKNLLANADLVFLTCGLGGGTGTGSLPVIAKFAKEESAIVIAVVTLPFKIEGARIEKAENGLAELRKVCDTVIVIENQRLLKLAGKQPLQKAFAVADDLIATMIKGITETISQPSLVNLDFADVKAVMRSGGVASIGVGYSNSEDERAIEAIERALNHPLLNVEYHGASGALIQVICGEDVSLEEINYIGERVMQMLDPQAQVIWGARIVKGFNGIQVITIITGVKSAYILGPVQYEEHSETAKVEESDLGIEIIR